MIAPVQQLTGLSAEAISLLRWMFAVVVVLFGGVIVAAFKTKSTWLPSLRGWFREGAESDPHRGNGSLRDDFQKQIMSLQSVISGIGSAVLNLQQVVTDIGGSLVKSSGQTHTRLDGFNIWMEKTNIRIEAMKGDVESLAKQFNTHLEDGQKYIEFIEEIQLERTQIKETTGREPGRLSSPAERAAFVAGIGDGTSETELNNDGE